MVHFIFQVWVGDRYTELGCVALPHSRGSTKIVKRVTPPSGQDRFKTITGSDDEPTGKTCGIRIFDIFAFHLHCIYRPQKKKKKSRFLEQTHDWKHRYLCTFLAHSCRNSSHTVDLKTPPGDKTLTTVWQGTAVFVPSEGPRYCRSS